MYQARVQSQDEIVAVRGLNVHMRHWGPADAPLLVMVHGWMDVGASFQFVVDELKQRWHVVAPDWRGFGYTDWTVTAPHGPQRNYWFPDYLADLDAILDYLSPNEPVRLVGHSMGGNISLMYAGIRPHRIASLVNLEGFGMPDTPVHKVPGRYAKWLDELKVPPRMRHYQSLEEVAARLQQTNPRLQNDKALFLAQLWSRPTAEGSFELLGDPAHKIGNPLPYRLADMQAVWSSVTAPVLHVEATETEAGLWLAQAGVPVDFDAFRTRFHCIPNWRAELVTQAGHMLHHDQPEQVAQLIEGHCAV